MNLTMLGTFFLTAGLLAITPGPGILFVLAQTIRGDKRRGFSATIGTGLGGMMHVLFGALGFSALIYSSAMAFTTMKMIGSLYLLYLAYKTLKEKFVFNPDDIESIGLASEPLRQGFITEALNPKTALFFLALLPQFIDPSFPAIVQFLALGTLVVFLNTTVDFMLVMGTSKSLNYIHKHSGAYGKLRFLSGLCYLFLALITWSAKSPNALKN